MQLRRQHPCSPAVHMRFPGELHRSSAAKNAAQDDKAIGWSSGKIRPKIKFKE